MSAEAFAKKCMEDNLAVSGGGFPGSATRLRHLLCFSNCEGWTCCRDVLLTVQRNFDFHFSFY